MNRQDAEVKAEKLFTKYRRQIIKKFGARPLWDDEIDKYARERIPSFKGVYPHDKLPIGNGSYIVNTGGSKSKGIHWVAIFRSPSVDYIYDSFSRPIPNILKSYNGHGRRLNQSDPSDIEQHDQYASQRDVCGHLSLAWLLVARDLGVKAASLI